MRLGDQGRKTSGGIAMAGLEAKAASGKEQSCSGYDSAEWRAWMKRALKNFNARARRMMKKMEGVR